MSSLLVGTAVVDITPPVGIPLGGWAQERHSEWIHAPLTCRALYLRGRDQVAVVVTLDVLGLARGLTDAIRQEAVARLGDPAAIVLVASSHTHSGPVLPPYSPIGVPAPDEMYVADLVRKAAGAVEAATRSPLPVSVGFGRGHSDLAISRRLAFDNGKVGFPARADPDGAVDREVGVLRFDGPDGRPVAILFSYGCHPTVAGMSTWLGPDYPGPARRLVESYYPGASAFFLLGNCGDVRTNFTNPNGSFIWDGSADLVEEAGARLGAEVIKTAVQIRTVVDPVLRSGHSGADVYTTDGAFAQRCDFHALRIGDAAIVTNPAECFCRVGLDVRSQVDVPVLFSSLTNGYLGYVPTKVAYPYGGYEVERSYRNFGLSAPVRADTEDVFRAGMVAALEPCIAAVT